MTEWRKACPGCRKVYTHPPALARLGECPVCVLERFGMCAVSLLLGARDRALGLGQRRNVGFAGGLLRELRIGQGLLDHEAPLVVGTLATDVLHMNIVLRVGERLGQLGAQLRHLA